LGERLTGSQEVVGSSPISSTNFFSREGKQKEKIMRRKFLLAALVCLAVVSCDLFNPKKFADVVMTEGPRYEDGGTSFSFVGTVRNVGEGKALFVRVYIDLKNPNGDFLAQGYHLVDKQDLEFGESSTWRVTFEDEDFELRDLMDESRTTYDISWREED
jgi:hypothetical protein